MAAGPHPRRELTLTPSLGFPCPRSGVAAGAAFFTGGGAPPPPRTDADTFARISMSSLRCGRRRFYSLAAGPHPRRELTLTPSLGSPCPRSGVAAGASFTGGGAPPPPRTDADTFARISMSSLRCGRRRFFTGGGAPPPPRTDADTFARISMSSLRCGRRRFFTGGGAPPPPRTDADTFARISMSSLRCGRRRFLHWRRGPTPAAN